MRIAKKKNIRLSVCNITLTLIVIIHTCRLKGGSEIKVRVNQRHTKRSNMSYSKTNGVPPD